MIAHAHGRRESLASLRRRYPTSLGGASLKDLVSVADAIGFSARAVRCELEELAQLQTPAILHWSLDHYVVLRRATRGHVWIADPALGERRLALAEASQSFTGVALELTPTADFVRIDKVERVKLWDLWSRVVGLRKFLIQAIILTFFLQCVALLTPLANQIVIDDVITRGDKDLLTAVLYGFGVLILIQGALELLRGFVQLNAAQNISLSLSGNLLRHLLRLPNGFFERRHVGDVMSRFASLKPVQNFLTSGLVGVVLDAVMVIPVGVVMFLYSPLLSGIAVANVLVVLVIRGCTFPRARRLADESIGLTAKTESLFLETVRGARAIKIAAREPERHGLWQNAFSDQQNAAFQQSAFTLWGGGLMGVWQALVTLILLYVGALQIIEGKLTLGMFFAFQNYASQFGNRANGLTGAYFNFQLVRLHLERLADIVHAETEKGLADIAAPHVGLEGAMEAQRVRFRYSQFDPWVLDRVDFKVAAGETVALVGRSGGGKSTLLKLMMGLYEPTEGDVLIDGHPLRSVGLRGVRERVGVVMQDDQLFSGTIADNVAFFDSAINMTEVEAACRLAHVHDEIIRTPMGYHSLVGDMGSVLSGGQRQRILLARALYKKPTILFMDEGTANLDPALENQIMQTLDALPMTKIIVAHRPGALVTANRILAVDAGRVLDVTGLGLGAEVANGVGGATDGAV